MYDGCANAYVGCSASTIPARQSGNAVQLSQRFYEGLALFFHYSIPSISRAPHNGIVALFQYRTENNDDTTQSLELPCNNGGPLPYAASHSTLKKNIGPEQPQLAAYVRSANFGQNSEDRFTAVNM